MPKTSRRKPTNNNKGQSPLPIYPSADEQLDVSALEMWLWDAACAAPQGLENVWSPGVS